MLSRLTAAIVIKWALTRRLYTNKMHISHEQLSELTEVIEDTVEYFCDKERVSGEMIWLIVESLATAKIAELNGTLASV